MKTCPRCGKIINHSIDECFRLELEHTRHRTKDFFMEMDRLNSSDNPDDNRDSYHGNGEVEEKPFHPPIHANGNAGSMVGYKKVGE